MTDRSAARSPCLGALLAFAGSVAADTMKADGDGLTTTIDLGAVAPGAVLTVDVDFVLTCASIDACRSWADRHRRHR